MTPVLIGLGVYLAFIVGLGLWIGRRVTGTGDFFVAGRRLGPLLVFATLLAANVGAASTVGAAGLGYRDGISAWWWVGSAGLGTILLGLWIAPRIWRIAKREGLLTVGDYLELRYGPSVRGIIAALLWVGTLAILAGQLIAMAEIFEAVTGAPRWMGAMLGGVVMMIYFTAGGLLSSAWVNLVQLGVMVIGFAVAVPVALSAVGGFEALSQAASDIPDYDNFFRGGGSGWIYLFLIAPAFIVSPGILQKTFGAVDERAIRIGVVTAGVALLVFSLGPVMLGMIAQVYDPGLARRELALPVILSQGVPAAIGTLGLAAVLSAEISSADAILFMLSTSLSKDLYKRFLRPDASDAQVLKVARWAAVAGGAGGLALALVLPSVVASVTIFYSLLGVSLFVPVIAGLFTTRPGVAEALAAICAGVIALVVARTAGWADATVWGDPSFVGLVMAALAFGLWALGRHLFTDRGLPS